MVLNTWCYLVPLCKPWNPNQCKLCTFYIILLSSRISQSAHLRRRLRLSCQGGNKKKAKKTKTQQVQMETWQILDHFHPFSHTKTLGTPKCWRFSQVCLRFARQALIAGNLLEGPDLCRSFGWPPCSTHNVIRTQLAVSK